MLILYTMTLILDLVARLFDSKNYNKMKVRKRNQ